MRIEMYVEKCGEICGEGDNDPHLILSFSTHYIQKDTLIQP